VTAAARSQFHVVRCADVSVDHIILGELSRGEIVNGWFRQLACPALLSGERPVRAQILVTI